MMKPIKVTARIESGNSAHASIGVFQNGGKAGIIIVEAEAAHSIVAHLNAFDTEAPRYADADVEALMKAWDKLCDYIEAGSCINHTYCILKNKGDCAIAKLRGENDEHE